MQESTFDFLLELPDEIILEIISKLDIQDLMQVRLACKELKIICNDYLVDIKEQQIATTQNNNNIEDTTQKQQTAEKFSAFVIRKKLEKEAEKIKKEKDAKKTKLLKKLQKVEDESDYNSAHGEVDEFVKDWSLEEKEQKLLSTHLDAARNHVISEQNTCNFISSGSTYIWNIAMIAFACFIDGLWLGLATYYPKSNFKPTDNCEGNVTHESVAMCQEQIDIFLTETSVAWYLTGIIVGLIVQMLDRYAHDQLAKRILPKFLPTSNDKPSIKEKIAKFFWFIYENRNYLGLAAWIALLVFKLEIANDQAEECINSETNEYVKLNQKCITDEVNHYAKEILGYSLADGFLLTFAFAATLGLLYKTCKAGHKAVKWTEECYKNHGLLGRSDDTIPLTSTPQRVYDPS